MGKKCILNYILKCHLKQGLKVKLCMRKGTWFTESLSLFNFAHCTLFNPWNSLEHSKRSILNTKPRITSEHHRCGRKEQYKQMNQLGRRAICSWSMLHINSSVSSLLDSKSTGTEVFVADREYLWIPWQAPKYN